MMIDLTLTLNERTYIILWRENKKKVIVKFFWWKINLDHGRHTPIKGQGESLTSTCRFKVEFTYSLPTGEFNI